MPCRKCVYCEQRWPKSREYEFCPWCQERCVVSSAAPKLSEREARAEAKRARFNWHLLDSWMQAGRVGE